MPITNIATLAVDIVVNARRAQGALHNIQQQGKNTANSFNNLAKSIQLIGLGASAFLLIRKAVSILHDTVKESIVTFAKLEEQILNIEKVGKTGDLDRLSKAFFELGTTIKGADFKEISNAMVVAARSGVRGTENIKSLAEAALILSNISLDIESGEATEGLAALSINLDLSFEKTKNLANAIDVLSDNTLSTSGEILKTSARLSGFADALGVSAAEITGLSAALLSTKNSATTVRTTLTRLFDVLLSEPFKAAEAVGFAGDSVRRFAELTRTDATEAVIQFVEAFAKLDFAKQTAVLDDLELGSSRISIVMRSFASNTDQVRTAIGLSTNAINNAASASSKLSIANQSTSARLAELNKNWTIFKANLITSGPILDTIIGTLSRLSEVSGSFKIGVTLPGETTDQLLTQIRSIDKRRTEILHRLNELEGELSLGLLGQIGETPQAVVGKAFEAHQLKGEFDRLSLQVADFRVILRERQKSEEEVVKTQKALSEEEQKIINALQKAFEEEKLKEINKAFEKATDTIKSFEPDSTKRRIQSVFDDIEDVRKKFAELEVPAEKTAMILSELSKAGEKLIKTVLEEEKEKKDSEAKRRADEERRELDKFATGIGRFAGDFGKVIETLATVSELTKLFGAGDVAGKGALARLAFDSLFGDEKKDAPRILSGRAFRDEILTGTNKKRDKLDADRLTLARKMVELMEAEPADRRTMIEILDKIEKKELKIK